MANIIEIKTDVHAHDLITQLQVAHSEQRLSELESTSYNFHQMSYCSLLRGVSKVNGNFKLRKYRFENYNSVESFITDICLNGNNIQKQALSEVFDLKAIMCMPDLKKIIKQLGEEKGTELVIDFLVKQVESVADFFGVKIIGDIEEMSWIIISEFGGLSFLDFVFFTNRLKKREFVGDMQFINTHGMNPNFFLDWLNQYCDKRGQVQYSLIKDLKERKELASSDRINDCVEVGAIVKMSEHTKKEKARIVLLETQAEELRLEHSSSTDWAKFKDFVFYEIVGVVFQSFNSEQATEKTKQICDSIVKIWKTEHEAVLTDIEFSDYAKAQAKAIMQMIKAYGSKSAYQIIADGIYTFKSKSDEINEVETLLTFIFGKGDYSDFSETATIFQTINYIANRDAKQIEASYLPYLEQCIEFGACPLRKDRYCTIAARKWVYRNFKSDLIIDALKFIDE